MEAERYEVLEKIGHGSFGVIRKVRRKADGHILCRKEVSYNRMSTKEREQLQAELNILRTLRHPNIVAYLEKEHIKPSSELHIYMEYCEEGDLGKRIQQLKASGQNAPEDFVWSVFTQIVCGLYRCHYGEDPPPVSSHVVGLSSDAKPLRSKASHNMILHRDLKPENIFLGTDSSVKLGDFGLSKLISSHDFASTYVGTPYYMSPELCMSEPYNQHSDIWAFGCIMYELCVKSPPFNARTHVDLVQKIRGGRIETPINSHVYSSELREAISKCLRQNPLTRPDAAQLLNLSAVKLKRKELEIYAQGRELKHGQERAERKYQELSKKLAELESREKTFKTDIENVVRREWEVKARLEIDRQLQLGMEQVWKNFDAQVAAGVAERMAQGPRSTADDHGRSSTPDSDDASRDAQRGGRRHCSQSTAGETDEFLSSTDISDVSAESPTFDKVTRPPLKKTARTPFGRAQTMFHGSPMDVQMADPSPAPIASLGLSPRRNDKPKPSALRRNIFDTDLSRADSADDEQPISPNVDDSDDDDVALLPSPTRTKTGTSGDPFKSFQPRRPSMPRQQTIPAVQPPLQPALFSNNHPLPQAPPSSSSSGSSGSSKENRAPTVSAQLPTFSRQPKAALSPNRRQSKLPSATSLLIQGESTSPTRKPNSPSKQISSQPNLLGYGHRLAAKKQETDIRQAAMANNMALQGRTLVELNMARANSNHGVSAHDFATDDVAQKGRGMRNGRHEDVTWDPEREEMPSPFLARTTKPINILSGAMGGPGLRHLR